MVIRVIFIKLVIIKLQLFTFGIDEDDTQIGKHYSMTHNGYKYESTSRSSDSAISQNGFTKTILSFIEREDTYQEIWMKSTNIQPSGTPGKAIVNK